MPRPRKTADQPADNRAVLYARVSTREQTEGYSLDAQVALLRSYALHAGLTVVAEYVEAESAKVSNRPAFCEMLKRVRYERITHLLVEKTDRLYRNLKDHVRVDELGVAVHLVKEGEILSEDSRSHQKFVHGIKLLVAKNYSDNLSEEAKKGMREKARQGIWPTKAPLGYLNVSVGSRRVIEPDPERFELVSWLFDRYAEANVSLKSLRDEAAERGLTTRKGRKVATNEIHSLLCNPVYYGLIRWADVEVDGIHPPLTDKATFQRVQDVMSGRNQTKEKPASARDFLYASLFKCGACGCLISPQTTKGHRYYACSGARGCSRRTVREEAITEAVASKLSEMAIRPEVLALLRQALKESSRDEAALRTEEVTRLRARQDELAKNLQGLYLDMIAGEVAKPVYTELRLQWEFELASVETTITAYQKAKTQLENDGLALMEFASNAYSRFKSADREDQREMARHLLSNSTITDRIVQVSFHEAFEMILETNREMPENAPEGVISEKWLAN